MRILLASDQADVRSALRFFLEQQLAIEVVGEVTAAVSLVLEATTSQPDLILFDWGLPQLQAAELIPALRSACPHTALVALGGGHEVGQVALAAGANGFVSKGEPPEQLLKMVYAFHECGV